MKEVVVHALVAALVIFLAVSHEHLRHHHHHDRKRLSDEPTGYVRSELRVEVAPLALNTSGEVGFSRVDVRTSYPSIGAGVTAAEILVDNTPRGCVKYGDYPYSHTTDIPYAHDPRGVLLFGNSTRLGLPPDICGRAWTATYRRQWGETLLDGREREVPDFLGLYCVAPRRLSHALLVWSSVEDSLVDCEALDPCFFAQPSTPPHQNISVLQPVPANEAHQRFTVTPVATTLPPFTGNETILGWDVSLRFQFSRRTNASADSDEYDVQVFSLVHMEVGSTDFHFVPLDPTDRDDPESILPPVPTIHNYAVGSLRHLRFSIAVPQTNGTNATLNTWVPGSSVGTLTFEAYDTIDTVFHGIVARPCYASCPCENPPYPVEVDSVPQYPVCEKIEASAGDVVWNPQLHDETVALQIDITGGDTGTVEIGAGQSVTHLLIRVDLADHNASNPWMVSRVGNGVLKHTSSGEVLGAPVGAWWIIDATDAFIWDRFPFIYLEPCKGCDKSPLLDAPHPIAQVQVARVTSGSDCLLGMHNARHLRVEPAAGTCDFASYTGPLPQIYSSPGRIPALPHNQPASAIFAREEDTFFHDPDPSRDKGILMTSFACDTFCPSSQKMVVDPSQFDGNFTAECEPDTTSLGGVAVTKEGGAVCAGVSVIDSGVSYGGDLASLYAAGVIESQTTPTPQFPPRVCYPGCQHDAFAARLYVVQRCRSSCNCSGLVATPPGNCEYWNQPVSIKSLGDVGENCGVSVRRFQLVVEGPVQHNRTEVWLDWDHPIKAGIGNVEFGDGTKLNWNSTAYTIYPNTEFILEIPNGVSTDSIAFDFYIEVPPSTNVRLTGAMRGIPRGCAVSVGSVAAREIYRDTCPARTISMGVYFKHERTIRPPKGVCLGQPNAQCPNGYDPTWDQFYLNADGSICSPLVGDARVDCWNRVFIEKPWVHIPTAVSPYAWYISPFSATFSEGPAILDVSKVASKVVYANFICAAASPLVPGFVDPSVETDKTQHIGFFSAMYNYFHPWPEPSCVTEGGPLESWVQAQFSAIPAKTSRTWYYLSTTNQLPFENKTHGSLPIPSCPKYYKARLMVGLLDATLQTPSGFDVAINEQIKSENTIYNFNVYPQSWKFGSC